MPVPTYTLAEISLKTYRGGCDLGGVTNHMKAFFILHLLKDQRDIFVEGPCIYWGEYCLGT